MMSAVSAALVYAASVSITLELAITAVAGLFIAAAVIEYGLGAGAACYAVASFLCLLLAPEKEAALLFACLFGHYPLLKSVIETQKWSKPAEWISKIAVFNISAGVVYLILLVTGLLPKDMWGYTAILYAAGILVLNAVFVLYDVALGQLITFYRLRIRNKLRKR